MAKRNSPGSTGNRRGSSRSTTGKTFSGKNTSKSSSKSGREEPRKPSFKKDDNQGSRTRSTSAKPPFKKFDRETPRKSSFSKDERGGDTVGRKSSGRTFTKSDSERPRKPFVKGGRDSDGRKSSAKPFNKFESEKSSRPSFKKNETTDSESRRSPRSFDKKEGSKRPSFGKSDRKFSAGKDSKDIPYKPSARKDGDGGSENKKGAFSKSKGSFSSAPIKKFSKPFDKPGQGEDAPTEGRERRYSSTSNRYGSGKPYKKGQSTKRDDDEKRPTDPDKIRLNRYIANSGICSRREADEFITMGLVSVNGKVITELGYKVSRTDEIRYEDKVLKAEKPVYILMNKPKGYLTTTKDPEERKTVMHILGSDVKERVYPVGRLDRNTTGLLLLTNDGDLADKLMHPSYNVKKIYKVELDRPITKADFKKVQEGVRLEEGKAMVDDLAIVSDDGKTVGIEIHIGWNRVVRRIFESLEYEVVKLDRTSYAELNKKELPRGHWRFLKKEEIVHLKHFK